MPLSRIFHTGNVIHDAFYYAQLFDVLHSIEFHCMRASGEIKVTNASVSTCLGLNIVIS